MKLHHVMLIVAWSLTNIIGSDHMSNNLILLYPGPMGHPSAVLTVARCILGKRT